MSQEIYAGDTSVTIDLWVPDSSSTVGAGLTGIVHNAAGLSCYYVKGATGAATSITLATQTATGAYSSGGFVQRDATNLPGLYRLDLPNAAVDTEGVLKVMLHGATNAAPVVKELMIRRSRATDFAAIADQILARSVSFSEASAAEHSLATIILGMLEFDVVGGTWNIKRSDGSTPHATKTLATDPLAAPVTGVS
jgi:hypothetical protein